MKKTEGRKSRDTVPLNINSNSASGLKMINFVGGPLFNFDGFPVFIFDFCFGLKNDYSS
jgi:hypothetical protein